ncbi:olfactory receptor-like protein OLF1 [Rhinatrema bivittatum]|uniref:olfactory receptor-like protein OLF1 n=1 Tax=Rhinatrema bivittatum TaxID=194408 RepID=UPI0011286BF3|nr:olfactory receptor-like protein OLF1 [Rhinatrema bivittatum]
MGRANNTFVTEFILVGFAAIPQLQIALFVIFLTIYIFTITTNLLIIGTVRAEQHLHKPMYFFISNFSVLEICYTNAIIPKMMVGLVTGNKSISVQGCIIQFYFVSDFSVTLHFLLAVMSYDRYLAICRPLHYTTIMTSRVCGYLALFAWTAGHFAPFMPAVMVSNLYFCGPQNIDHFFCDFAPLLKLSCTDTSLAEVTYFAFAWSVILCCFFFTLVSYVHIISTVLRIKSPFGRQKTFSTCTSHLAVVSIYYGSVIFIYIRPTARTRFHWDKVVSVFYSMVTPVFNPIVYSLRNQEVKKALAKVLYRHQRLG